MTQRNVDRRRTEKPAPRKRTVLTADEWAQLFTEYRAGATGAVLAAKYGVSPHTIYVYARKLGCAKTVRIETPAPEFADLLAAIDDSPLPPAPRHIVRRRHDEHEWRKARRDYEADCPAKAVAARYQMTVHAIRRRIAVEGWRRVGEAHEPIVAPHDPAQMKTLADGAIVSAWDDIAHAAQRAPASLPDGGDWSTWLFFGGRGAGKTRAGAEWLAARALASPRGRFALVGATLHDVREVMIEGPSGILSLPGHARPRYERARRRLVWDCNGAEAFGFSAEEPERLRGPQFDGAWADEFCAWPRHAYTLMLLRLGLRLGKRPQLVVTTTPRPLKTMRDLKGEASCVVTQAPTSANAAHLAPAFVEGVRALYVNTRWESQELDGVLLDGEGALFRHEDFVAARGVAPERCARVVVAVDPPAGVDGAACGIVVAGRSEQRGYVLADATVRGAMPMQWAHAVCAAARAWNAAEIVAEANQGGAMVRTVLAMADPPCPVRLVHAARSKHARAMPVAALYEQKRIVHAGVFAALEEELMSLSPDGEGRLDRADALVHALTVLMVGPERLGPRIRAT